MRRPRSSFIAAFRPTTDCGKLGQVRVVLDTNILISACLKPAGLEARVVELAFAGIIEACVTEEVESEYREVLCRDKFRPWRERAEIILAAFARRAVRVTASQPLQVATDEDDNRFLECACAARAGF